MIYKVTVNSTPLKLPHAFLLKILLDTHSLLHAGVLAPLNAAGIEAAALALGWPRDARALLLCTGVAAYALFCLYTVQITP